MLKALLIGVLLLSAVDDPKYCGTPKRLPNGDILRRLDVLDSFKKVHPCPANGRKAGPCPGWNMDHVIPLACGGCDSITNLQWLPTAVWQQKSKFERKIYGGNNISHGCP